MHRHQLDLKTAKNLVSKRAKWENVEILLCIFYLYVIYFFCRLDCGGLLEQTLRPETDVDFNLISMNKSCKP